MKTLLLFTLFCLATQIYSQSDTATNAKKGWDFAAIPAVAYNSDLGFQYGLLANLYDYGNGDDYPNYKQFLSIGGAFYTKGSSIFRLFYDSNTLLSKVRLIGDLNYVDDQALNFFGFNGYDAYYNKDFENEASPDYVSRVFYKYHRKVYTAKVDLHGKMPLKNVKWVVGLSYTNVKIGTVPILQLNKGKDANEQLPNAALLYDKYMDWGIIEREESDGGQHLSNYLGLIYDTRNNEALPTKGVWTEALMLSSLGNEYDFGKIGITHRQYFTLLPKQLSLAYRISYQANLWGKIPFYMYPYLMYSFQSSSIMEGLGGASTIRGVLLNRVVSHSEIFGNIELRWKFAQFDLLNQHWYLATSPFVDFGRSLKKIEINMSRVPEDEESLYFANNAERLHWTAGCGLRIAMNENFIVAADCGKAFNSQDGNVGLYIGMNWLF